MILSRAHLKEIVSKQVELPPDAVFELPEKVLQFGTGVLLRGLPDYLIDKANRMGYFNGRIVVVKSTDKGDTTAFDRQDGLYTLCVRGIAGEQTVEENIVCAAISRVLSAGQQWATVLQCAHQPALQVIISNSTEVGIRLVEEDIRQSPPASFPAKLLAFLYERFIAFNGSPESGMVIVPTELIAENGNQLQAIVVALARFNQLGKTFIDWLTRHNFFCNSLVDRIVPGAPVRELHASLEAALGYQDALMTISEQYRLWAIEGGEPVRKVLSFYLADEGVVIAPDIDLYRELKLRLLNGTHTLSCGLAYLMGIRTVKEGMQHPLLSAYITTLMLRELALAIPYPVPPMQAATFGRQVLDRFRNPHIEHQWLSISMQYSSKMRMRNVPTLLKYYSTFNQVPTCFSIGFAAYLLFMKAVKQVEGKYLGSVAGEFYPIQDECAAYFFEKWQMNDLHAMVKEILADDTLWGTDLTQLNDFANRVYQHLQGMLQEGLAAFIEQQLPESTISE